MNNTSSAVANHSFETPQDLTEDNPSDTTGKDTVRPQRRRQPPQKFAELRKTNQCRPKCSHQLSTSHCRQTFLLLDTVSQTLLVKNLFVFVAMQNLLLILFNMQDIQLFRSTQF